MVATLAILFGSTSRVSADLLVAPNANTSTSGDNVQYGILDTGNVAFQFAYNATQFSTLTSGTQITGIGFRLPAGASTFNTALVYSSFGIQIGQSTAAPGALSTTFATNEAGDTITAYSGPLTIGAGSFVGGAGPNPFVEITFTTPYTYTGGNLLVTLRHSDPGSSISVDANSFPGINGIADTVADFGDANGTSGTEGYFNAPVAGFYFNGNSAATPEPASLTLLGIGIAGIAGQAWRRKRAAV
jgi:PEP-CTERM motif